MIAIGAFHAFPASAASPWKDGETVTYHIYWGMIFAAEADFMTARDGDFWDLKMELRSRGVVEGFYPIRSNFSSRQEEGRWRSHGFHFDRNEGERVRKGNVRIDYAAGRGVFRNEIDGKNKEFDVNGDMDDFLSMLYSLRRVDWKREKQATIRTYENQNVKEGIAKLIGHEPDGITGHRGTPLLVIEALETVAKDSTRRPLWAKIWITDDEQRIPVRAELRIKYGTFVIKRP